MATKRCAVVLLAIAFAFVACRPTYKDFNKDTGGTHRRYLTGTAEEAKVALLEEEKIIAKHELAGNRDIDFARARQILYARLCAVTVHLGQTQEAAEYLNKSAAQKLIYGGNTNGFTVEAVVSSIERADRDAKWMKQK
jgi:hypothetical protein